MRSTKERKVSAWKNRGAATGTERRRRCGLWTTCVDNPPHRPGLWAAAGVLAAVVALSACGSSSDAGSPGPPAQLETYVQQIEPLRLAVNRLLERADPILGAYREHRIGPNVAQRRFDHLERRFAAYATRIAAIRAPAELRRAAGAHAHTHVPEDSHLGAPAAAPAPPGVPANVPEPPVWRALRDVRSVHRSFSSKSAAAIASSATPAARSPAERKRGATRPPSRIPAWVTRIDWATISASTGTSGSPRSPMTKPIVSSSIALVSARARIAAPRAAPIRPARSASPSCSRIIASPSTASTASAT